MKPVKPKKKKKKDRKKSFQIWQDHHILYPNNEEGLPERTVRLTRTEHFFCGRIENYAKAHGLSLGMCEALIYYIGKYKGYKIKE